MNTQETNQVQPVPELAPVPASVAVAAAPAMAAVDRRVSPGLALVLSFFPGLGHLYLGMYHRAVVVFLAFAVSLWLGDHADLGILVPFVVCFALVDAYRHAKFINSGVPVEVETPLGAKGQTRKGILGFGVFLAVAGLILLYNNFYSIDFSFMHEWWPMLLVVAGAWLVGSFFWERRRRDEGIEGSLEPTI